jgi:hypothetical protein
MQLFPFSAMKSAVLGVGSQAVLPLRGAARALNDGRCWHWPGELCSSSLELECNRRLMLENASRRTLSPCLFRFEQARLAVVGCDCVLRGKRLLAARRDYVAFLPLVGSFVSFAVGAATPPSAPLLCPSFAVGAARFRRLALLLPPQRRLSAQSRVPSLAPLLPPRCCYLARVPPFRRFRRLALLLPLGAATVPVFRRWRC